MDGSDPDTIVDADETPDDETRDDGTTDDSTTGTPPRRRRWLRTDGIDLPILFGFTAFVLGLTALQPGHFWGDDFALYIRQGEGLVHFDTGRVIRDIHYTVKWSKVKGFTPDVYPWGTSILLAIPLSIVGRDITALKVTMAFTFAVGAASWFSIARRRMPLAAAMASAVCFCMSLPMIRWVDVVGSDLPYLAMVGVCLAVLSRWLSRGPITTRQAVALGALGAASFTFRNEGLGTTAALLLGIALSHLFTVTRATWRPVLNVAAMRCAAAGGVAVAITAVLKVFLPYDMLPSYKGTGPGNITKNWSEYMHGVTAQFGFFSDAMKRFEAIHNPTVGTLLLYLFVLLLGAGLVRMVVRHDVMDVVLLFTAVIHAYTALTFMTPSPRYMYTTVAVMFIVVAQGAATLVGGFTRWVLERKELTGPSRYIVATVTFALVASFAAVQISPYRTFAKYASTLREHDRAIAGPYQPGAIEMYAAVLRYTTAQDVILTYKPRAMTLYTNRSSVKIKQGATPPEVATFIAIEAAPDYDVRDMEGIPDDAQEVWKNNSWHLVRLKPTPGD